MSKNFLIVQHSSATDSWGTPLDIIRRVYNVLDGIDLDPASSEAWNKTVNAEHFYTKDQNGLVQPWAGRVFVNPPGGKTAGKSNTGLWWDKLTKEVARGKITDAIFVAFSVEALAMTQQFDRCMLDFPFCIPAKRIAFVSEGEAKSSPSHSNAIVYVPGLYDRTGTFRTCFSGLGKVVVP